MDKQFNRELFTVDEEKFVKMTKEFTDATKWYYEPINSARVSEGYDEEGEKRLFLKSKSSHLLNGNGKQSLPIRAGIGGVTIGELNNEDWIKVLNTCFPYRAGNMILNELEGEVYAAHSEQYAIINIDEVFETAKQVLHLRFPNITYVCGSLSPEFAFCEYSLANEQEVRDVYETALGETFEKSLRLVAPTIRICTSNTSDSGANIYPCLKCVDENGAFYSILAGSPLVAIHKGCNSIKKVRENLEMSMDMFKKSAENLIRLTYIKVNYPKQCFLNIAKRLCLPKPAAMEIAEEIGDMFTGGRTTTAKFIYLALTRILEKTIKKNEMDSWNLANNIAHAMSLDFKLYDTKSCEWLKKSRDENQVSLFLA